MKKYLLLLCSAFFILSCNDDSQIPPKEEKLIPTKIISEWIYEDNWYQKDSTLFEYDNLNIPIKVTNYTTSIWSGLPDNINKSLRVATFEYNNKDVILHEKYYKIGPSNDLTFEVIRELKLETSNSGTIYIKSRDSLSENFKDDGTLKFTIDDEGRFVTYDNDKYWYDDKGNIVRGIYFNTVEKVYKYENKNGVFKDVDIPPYMKAFLYIGFVESFSPQAVVEGNAINDNYVDKYVNEYNENNYPKKSVWTRAYKAGNFEPDVTTDIIEYKRK